MRPGSTRTMRRPWRDCAAWLVGLLADERLFTERIEQRGSAICASAARGSNCLESVR